ncbi:MAG: hypothetical protein VXW34_10820 [Actinomycetota bacterium]|nr:hypothetical protein [Actinomycetota bacterium]
MVRVQVPNLLEQLMAQASMRKIVPPVMERTSKELTEALLNSQSSMSQITTAMTRIVQQFEMERRNTTGLSETCQQFRESPTTRSS